MERKGCVMKKTFALLVVLLFVLAITAGMAFASYNDPEGDPPPGEMLGVPHDLHGYGVGYGHDIHGDGDDPTIGPGNSSDAPAWGHVPEFPLVALPGIVGFAGLALLWIRGFIRR